MLRLIIAPVSCIVGLVFLTGLLGCASQSINWDPDDYTVTQGDTLYSIAWRYEIDADDLARWNALSSPYIIHPGERLHTRPSKKSSTHSSAHSSARSSVRSSPSNREGTTQAKKESAAVDNESQTVSQRRRSQSQITVKKGDTLYSLAKENYMPAWKLAMINDIKKPYVLQPGQRLNLQTSSTPPQSVRSRTTTAWKKPVNQASLKWQWPIRGKIIGKFNRRLNDAKGIDIAGKTGANIRAAAAGKVVYSGNGLIHYGHLVIIKHSRDYLSAYANNRKLLVKEGETVKSGQNIAELGAGESKTPHLHFEIRKKGKPVDPLRYLPRS